MATLLSPEQLQDALGKLPDWDGDGTAIRRTVHVEDTDGFLARLEAIAREMNHDPDTSVSGDAVAITMSTHSAGGVTDLDVEYARRVDALLG